MDGEPPGNVRRAAGLAATGALIASSLPMLACGIILYEAWERHIPPRGRFLTELAVASGILFPSATFVGYFGYRLERRDRRNWNPLWWYVLLVTPNVMAGLVMVSESWWSGFAPDESMFKSLCLGAFGGFVLGTIEGIVMFAIASIVRSVSRDE